MNNFKFTLRLFPLAQNIFLRHSSILTQVNSPVASLSVFNRLAIKIMPVQLAYYSTRDRKYLTPTETHNKTFYPSTIAVTKSNNHLDVLLFDKNNQLIGKMNLATAKAEAEKQELKLVIVEESSPPRFQLMTGSDLKELQMKLKKELKGEKEEAEKVVKINLGIGEHDLETKMKAIKAFHEKGHPIRLLIASKILNKKVLSVIFYLDFKLSIIRFGIFSKFVCFIFKGKKHWQAPGRNAKKY